MALLQERTLLACLHVGVWNNMMRDQEVNEEVANRHLADVHEAGSYSKRLIARKHLRHGVYTKANMLRRTHNMLTLPWEDGGVRILSTKSYFAYTEQMRLAKLGFEAAVQQFITQLPGYIEDAQRNVLGTMFKAEDYPTPDEVAAQFWVDIEIKPTPSAADFRAELSDQTVKAIVKDIERRTDQRLNQAMNDIFERIADATGKMVERLRAYSVSEIGKVENSFKDTLVSNVKDIAELLPALNITGDKRLDELQQKLIADLTVYGPDELRGSEAIRLSTADKAEELLKKVKSYMV